MTPVEEIVMGVELRPLGVTCNIMCQYCYQNPLRDSGSLRPRYDIDAMLAALAEDDEPFTLFGGEPLLLPLPDLERLWAFGLARFGRNRIQTNGTLITDRHMELFATYAVHVGISIDGPDALNDVRWAGSLDRTRDLTKSVDRAIAGLCERDLHPSLIITMHRGNGLPQHWPSMDSWLLEMQARGVRNVRLHALEVDSPAVQAHWAMTDPETIAAFLHFYRFEREHLTSMRFDIFDEMRALLRGLDDQTGCVWHGCDPYTTGAVHGIEGFGERSNCGRTNKRGIDFIKTEAAGYERSIALWFTPQPAGGCRDCRFFAMCKGQCPGTSIDGDWRNRSAQCALWTALFVQIEEDLLAAGETPLSCDPRRAEIEHRLIKSMMDGRVPLLTEIMDDLSGSPPVAV
ncbi:radical SAM protein [Bradyrhizobium oligotrophicum]|uniref:radical SAM protein n=1 Tax=Bradyrhizobium oligotrophicum TaxID=44255 RepID=UPI003EBEB495